MAGAVVTDLDEVGRRVAGWLGVAPLAVRRLKGSTNDVLELRNDRDHWVLRRPPPAADERWMRATTREHRLLGALDQTAVPHAAAVALCEDTAIIGTPFLVLDWVDGFSGWGATIPPPFDTDARARRALGDALVDTLAEVGEVDWRAVGLGDFGHPEGFLDRQVDRWLGHVTRNLTRELPHLDEVAAWLRAHQPAHFVPGLMHGDYSGSNVMLAPDLPPRVAAVIDWEQATVGDPLLDLGWMLGIWEQPGDDISGRDPTPRFSEWPDMPTREEVVERYAARSSRAVDDLPYYTALGLFKLCCVIEPVYGRYATGLATDPYLASYETRIPALLERALLVTEGGWI